MGLLFYFRCKKTFAYAYFVDFGLIREVIHVKEEVSLLSTKVNPSEVKIN